MPKRTSNPEYRKRRAEVLEGNPTCHWCKKAPATEADHLLPFDMVGDDTPLVASCKPCNAQRGAIYLAQKKAHVNHQRNEALGLQDGKQTPKPKQPENFLKKEKTVSWRQKKPEQCFVLAFAEKHPAKRFGLKSRRFQWKVVKELMFDFLKFQVAVRLSPRNHWLRQWPICNIVVWAVFWHVT